MTLLTCVMAWATDVNDAASFKAAWEDPSTTSIRLTDAITVSEVMVAAGNFTVDFNGHTITAGEYTLSVGGSYPNKLYNNVVTFTGEGGITAGAGCLDVYSKVVINGGKFEANTNGIWVNSAAELEMNGGSITTKQSALVLEGGTATITGGSITATKSGTGQAIGVQDNSHLEISGGSINAAHIGIRVSDGSELTFSNGEIHATYVGISAGGDGTTVIIEGGSISDGECEYGVNAGSGSTITVKNGTIVGQRGINIQGGTATIKNGTIVGGQKGIIILGGTLTVDDGSITGNEKNEGSGIDQRGGIATINGGTIYGRKCGIVIINNTSMLNIHGGTIVGDGWAITGNGSAGYGGTTINIDGGTIGSTSSSAGIYHPQAGTLTISGGTIQGKTGVGIKSGTLNMTAGTLHGCGEGGGRVETWGNGLIASNAALQIESNADYAGNMNISISGTATLISDSWYAIYEYGNGNTAVNSIAVTGGNFQGGIMLSQSLAAKGGFVSAGKWSKDITANVVKGKVANPIDEDPYFFEVGDPTPATAEIVNDLSKNAVLTNEDGETYAGSYTSETVGDDAEVKTSTATNQVVVSENTDVVVDKTDENNSTIVEVKKVTVEGDAQLSVKEGATLMVGTGSVLLDENTTTGGLTVEAGAALVVEGLVYGSTEDNFVIEGQEDKSGIVLFSPETEFIKEDHPKATYRFTSKSFYDYDNPRWVFQRFGMPSHDGIVTMKSTNTAVSSYVYTWNGEDWGAPVTMPVEGLVYNVDNKAVPFQCYQLASTNIKEEPTTYDFVVELMGNANAPLNFKAGWNPYANSYTAPIDIKEFLTDVLAEVGTGIDATVYLYKDLGNDTYTWQGINLSNAGRSYRVRENGAMVRKTYDATIEPMQAFIMKLGSGAEESTDINYLNSVYNPAMGIARPGAGAPARNRVSYNEVQIGAFNEKYWDNVSLMEGEQFSAGYDNGYDAPKYDNNKGLSLYVANGNARMERIATDNAEGLFIGIDAPEAGEYTLDFSGVNGMEYSVVDMQTGNVFEIAEDAEFRFYTEAGKNDYRFQLVAPSKVPTAIENTAVNANVKGVYTITGQYVGEDLNVLPKGVYVVNGVKVVK